MAWAKTTFEAVRMLLTQRVAKNLTISHLLLRLEWLVLFRTFQTIAQRLCQES
jgi:hypothetical protein